MADDDFTLLTFNIWNHHEGPAAFATRERAILETIAALNPDIVCLQEVPARSFARRLAERLTRVDGQARRLSHAARRVAMTEIIRPDGWREHIAIIHRGTRQVAARFDLEDSNRFAIGAFVHPGVFVVTAHFDPHDPDLRRAQATRLVEALDFQGRSLPTVVCGDFNAVPGGRTLDILRTRFGLLAPAGEPTFPTAVRTDIEQPALATLDHILGSGVAVEEHALLGDEDVAGLWLSDHIGVWARLRITA